MLSVNRRNNSYTASFQNTNRLNIIIADNIKTQLTSLVQSPENNVMLDFSGISFIDSNGFDALVEVMNAAKNNNAHFSIKNVSDEVMELFRLMKLDSALNASA